MAGDADVLVFRIDAGTLRAPTKTAQGFLKVEGHIGRAGIYRYINNAKDVAMGLGKLGDLRLELRPDDEVFKASAMGFDGAPITMDHPSEMINPTNVGKYSVGTVMHTRRDGNLVAATMLVQSKKAIDKLEGGKLNKLSPGYKARLEKKGGVDPKYGAYHFVQRDILPNHLALCGDARGGDELQVRMDSADVAIGQERRDDMGDMDDDLMCVVNETIDRALGLGTVITTSVDGHQHTLEGMSGRTSYEVSSGETAGHDHAFAHNADGTYIILDNAGHSHEVLVGERGDADDQPRDDDGKFGEGGGGGGSSGGDKAAAAPKGKSIKQEHAAAAHGHESKVREMESKFKEGKATHADLKEHDDKLINSVSTAHSALNFSKEQHATHDRATARASDRISREPANQRSFIPGAPDAPSASGGNKGKSVSRRDANDSAGASSSRLDGMVPQVRTVAADSRRGATTMETEEQIRSLKAQLAEATKNLVERTDALTDHQERADKAEARAVTLENKVTELTTTIQAGALANETAAIAEQAERADKAEQAVRDFDDRFDAAVRERSGIIRRACVVMGDEFNPDRMSNREIMSVVVKRLDAKADISQAASDATIVGRFDSLIDVRDRTARSLDRASHSITTTDRTDAAARGGNGREARTSTWRNQWKEPQSNSREARERTKGA